jgi:Uma2 family endonuclease
MGPHLRLEVLHGAVTQLMRPSYSLPMAQTARPLLSFDEYLRIEGDGLVRHEYLDGVVWAMGAGTDEHAALAANVIRLLGNQLLGRPCRVYTGDLRVRVRASGLTTYPDASVICDRVTFDPADPKRTTALNPKVLVEVTSRSTEQYDRGEKLAHYQRLTSLKAVLFISHRERRVTLVERRAGWVTVDLHAGDRVTLTEPAVSFTVDELYEGITLDPA